MKRRLICEIAKRSGAFIVSAGILASLLAAGSAASADAASAPAADADSAPAGKSETGSGGYFEYYNQYAEHPRPAAVISAVSDSPGDILLSEEAGAARWNFSVEEEGAYSVYIDYQALEGAGRDILLGLELDGKIPFKEAGEMSLPRIWADDNRDSESFRTDAQGNDLRPKQVEAARFAEKPLSDVEGLYSEPYLFYLTSGRHSLTLRLVREALTVRSVRLFNEAEPVSYGEYRENQPEAAGSGGDTLILQAEKAFEKSASTLYPAYDRTDVGTTPNDPLHMRLNMIGGANWSIPSQEISWKVRVPRAGYYSLAFRVRQNQNVGMASYRTLRVNGKIPFREARGIAFPYGQKWQAVPLEAEGEPALLYLEPGDVISLTAATGGLSAPLREIRQSMLHLNDLYRSVIIITGTSPDAYRDYLLDKLIPGIEERLSGHAEVLKTVSAQIKAMTGTAGSQASLIDRSAKVLSELAEDVSEIPRRLPAFKDAIETLGTLITTLGRQPLDLDYIAFVPEGAPAPRAAAGFWANAAFGFQKFIGSFFTDYNGMNAESKQTPIRIWISAGRDQAQILNGMIQDSFTAASGIPVNLSIVDTGATLIRATLAGKGPDAALMISEDAPVNLAMRGSLADLSQYGLEDLLSEFPEASLTPFRYRGGLYALPESQVFDMLFYRTDVFAGLNLTVPQTWDEFYRVLEVLQSNNLMVGIPEINRGNMGVSSSIGIFDKFLLQRGGTYYNEALSKTRFDTETAYSAFEDWAGLYAKYKLSREFDFYSRFRTGEMPLSIQPYSAYNQITQAAPELQGLWSFAPVPGTVREDGSVSRAETSAMAGCMMLSAARRRGVDGDAFAFLKWWTGAETQTRYGRELEAVLGVAARYTPAAESAFANMGWAKAEFAALKAQRDQVVNMPQIPGNYTVPRSLTNALRAALDGRNRPRRSLTLYNRDINDEIARKRAEFGLGQEGSNESE